MYQWFRWKYIKVTSVAGKVHAKEHWSALWISPRCHRFTGIAFHWTAGERVTFERRDDCVTLLASGLSHSSSCGMSKLPFPTGSVLPPLIHKRFIRKNVPSSYSKGVSCAFKMKKGHILVQGAFRLCIAIHIFIENILKFLSSTWASQLSATPLWTPRRRRGGHTLLIPLGKCDVFTVLLFFPHTGP